MRLWHSQKERTKNTMKRPALRKLLKNLGLFHGMRYLIATAVSRLFFKNFCFRLSTKTAKHPVTVRSKTSDLSVFNGNFVDLEYACIDDLENVDLVVDCGANVGYSSCYFLTRFEKSVVIAVEPDPENFGMLKKNLEPYMPRVTLLQSGVWSHSATLKIREAVYRDGGKWAVQVEECPEGTPDSLHAVDLNEILRMSGRSRISLLKMDIEGAEAVVFSSNCEDWIDKTDNIVIELHDDSVFGNCTDLVTEKLMRTGRFSRSNYCELTVFRSVNV